MFVVLRKNNKTLEIILLCAYILLLFVSAIIRDFIITPYVTHHIHGISAILVEPIWKLLFWILPTILYIWFVEEQNPLIYLKLTTNPLKGLLWGLYACIFIAAIEIGSILRTPTFHFSQSTDTWVNVILLVGLMEEIPFRGFLFQKLQSLFSPSWIGVAEAMLISSLLFAIIHFPLWLSQGEVFSFPLIAGFITIFVVGNVACIVLKLSNSLWGSIVVHTFYNLLISIL